MPALTYSIQPGPQGLSYNGYLSNPYPPPPPPVPHKVWIIDCKSCNTFLTNRAMKAVLLLRPSVSLYSSDALPVNCSAFSPNPDTLQSQSHCRPSTSIRPPPRGCECLTQTLCCHGCGSTIGYMIVIPCFRCTSSMTASNRATNGHRFVFHSSEIVATERHYVQGEAGVVPYEPTLEPQPAMHQQSATTPHSDVYSVPPSSQVRDLATAEPRSSTPDSISGDDYIPTPPLEFADPILRQYNGRPPTHTAHLARDSHHPSSNHQLSPRALGPIPEPNLRQPHGRSNPRSPSLQPPPHMYHLTDRPILPPSLSNRVPRDSTFGSSHTQHQNSTPYPISSSTIGVEQKEYPGQQLRYLKSGDVLFWHHLVKSGEIPGVQDDARSRKPIMPIAKRASEKVLPPAGRGFDR